MNIQEFEVKRDELRKKYIREVSRLGSYEKLSNCFKAAYWKRLEEELREMFDKVE